MAGNIIHAIATTNAIVSGLMTVEALKLLMAGAGQTGATGVLGAAALGERLSGRDAAGAALIVGAVGVSSGLVRRVATATRRRLRAMAGIPL